MSDGPVWQTTPDRGGIGPRVAGEASGFGLSAAGGVTAHGPTRRLGVGAPGSRPGSLAPAGRGGATRRRRRSGFLPTSESAEFVFFQTNKRIDFFVERVLTFFVDPNFIFFQFEANQPPMHSGLILRIAASCLFNAQKTINLASVFFVFSFKLV